MSYKFYILAVLTLLPMLPSEAHRDEGKVGKYFAAPQCLGALSSLKNKSYHLSVLVINKTSLSDIWKPHSLCIHDVIY